MEKKIGWANCLLDDVIVKMTNGCSAKQFNDKVGFPITRIETIWNETIDLERVKYIVEDESDLIDKYSLKYGDILLSHINSDTHLGKTAIFKNQCKTLIHGINLLLLRPSDYINADFLNYQFKFLRVKGRFIEVAQRAVNQSSINQRKLKNFEIILPPLPEQRAIVSKIEQLFSDLDNGISNLRLAQEQLKVYRQAVLKKAFEGELTRKWREQQTDLPDARDLLEQIRKEREEAAEASGKKVKPVKPLTEDEIAQLPGLPEGWRWVKIGDTTLGVEYGTSVKSSEFGQVPVLRMGNIQNGKFDWSDLVYTSDTAEIEKYLLKKDDVLFNRTNSPELVGKTAIYKGERPAIFAGYLIRVNQLPALVVAEYLNYFLNCHTAKVYGNSVKTDGVNQSNINGEKLKNYPLPLCSLPEQHAIVQEIEMRLSVCDKMAQDIDEALEKAEALRQSILKKVFEGKLLSERELAEVRMAEDWEPAEVLLERIRAERTGRSD